jgi:hypothetical protein
MMTKIKKSFTFVATVPLLLPIRTAQGSFFLWLFLAFNTPFLPIFDGTLKRFFLLKPLINA